MKRLLLALTTTLVAAALVVGTGTAGDTKGPSCANITFGDGVYDAFDESTQPPTPRANPVLTWDIIFDVPNCSSLTTLYVYDDSSTEPTPLVTLTATTTGTTSISFSYTFNQPGGAVGPSDNVVCLVGTSQYKKHVADRAPDPGGDCWPVADEPPGGSGFG